MKHAHSIRARWLPCLALAASLLPVGAGAATAAPDPVDVASHARADLFNDIKISPDGRYFAATVSTIDRTTLVVLERDGLKPVSRLPVDEGSHVDEFHWVGPERIVFSSAAAWTSISQPRPMGRLYAINPDGSDLLVVYGQRKTVKLSSLGSSGPPVGFGTLIDDLPNDDDHILVAVDDSRRYRPSWVERINVHTGASKLVVRAPVSRSRFLADAKGVVRFAVGSDSDNALKVFHRAAEGEKWKPFANQADDNQIVYPIGLDAQGEAVFLQLERADGTDEIVRHDLASGRRTSLLRDPVVDPGPIVWSGANAAVPIGSDFHGPVPRTAFFDEASEEAKLFRKLEAAFPGQQVRLTSTARNGALALVAVSSQGNPGDFYLFDTRTLQATYVLSRRTWIDTDAVAHTRPIKLSARDGLELHGFLTVPVGAREDRLPMVVLPHGGPFGVYDRLEFDPEAQLLADAGYAVLKVNFRGSGNYGRRFRELGARQWGGTMQDDLTDATRWAIEQGIADSSRICIYGASYGGYAALMGVAKEPSLYRCAAGYVGVYDLQQMVHMDARGEASENWHEEWVGKRSELGPVSPVKLAANIRVPVFLASGGADTTAPYYHSKKMEEALKKAGVPVESLTFDIEGHGFYIQANREEFYRRLLDFLAPHLGGRKAMPAPPRPAAEAAAP